MWRIDVTCDAAQGIASLDPTMKEEFIERVSAMAEDPLPALRRSLAGSEPAGMYVFAYRSVVDPELELRLFFAGLDVSERRMTLVAVARVMDGGETR